MFELPVEPLCFTECDGPFGTQAKGAMGGVVGAPVVGTESGVMSCDSGVTGDRTPLPPDYVAPPTVFGQAL
jgi:hypothetical protein